MIYLTPPMFERIRYEIIAKYLCFKRFFLLIITQPAQLVLDLPLLLLFSDHIVIVIKGSLAEKLPIYEQHRCVVVESSRIAA